MLLTFIAFGVVLMMLLRPCLVGLSLVTAVGVLEIGVGT